MKRSCLLLSLLLVLSCFVIFPASAANIEKGYPPDTTTKITAEGVYLKNLDTGEVIYEKNADAKLYPASTTKIMTAILALESTDDITTEKVVYPIEVQNYLYEYQQKHGAISTGQLDAGEEMTMEDFLYASMLPSANEAAMSIALHVGGSQDAFARKMTDRASEIGATNTSFKNPSGLFDKDHYTSARDMGLITEHALNLDGFIKIVSTPYYKAGPTNKHETLTWDSTIDMQKKDHPLYYPPLMGVKTGTLPESGRCFVSIAEKDGFRYMLVLLGSELDAKDGMLSMENRAFEETRAIYDWVFDSFRMKTLVDQGFVVGEIPINLSWDVDSVQLITSNHFSALMPDSIDTVGEDSQIKQVLEVPDFLNAPIEKGIEIGNLVLYHQGEEIGRVPVNTASRVEASKLLLFFQQIQHLLKSFWFKFGLIYIALLLVSYIILVILRNKNNKQRRTGNYNSRY